MFLPKMSAYRGDFDGTKYISVLIKNYELLGKYKEIWNKFKILSKKNLVVNLHTMRNIYKLK